MPNYDALRLRHQKAVDARLTAAHRRVAEQMALVVMAAAGSDGKIANTLLVREAVRLAMWERAIKPFYIGAESDALVGDDPQSPFAKLLVEGITQATRIEAERHAALVRSVCPDKQVVAWLLGDRPSGIVSVPAGSPLGAILRPAVAGVALKPIRDTLGGLRGVDGRIDRERAKLALVKPRGQYDAFHLFVDPGGHRLSDRIWNTGVEVRARVDRLMEYHIAQGTSAVDIAKLLDPFMTPGGRIAKTKTPYGSEGSYAARRLARTEVTAASGRAVMAASAANPFVGGVQWRLSGSHREPDQCDVNAHGGPNGDGIYAPENVPRYPNHPHELCSLLPVPVGTTDDLVASIKADIAAAKAGLIDAVGGPASERGLRLQGLLNPKRMTKALLDGTLDTTIGAAVKRSAARLPAGVRARPVTATMPAPKVVARELDLANHPDLVARIKDKDDKFKSAQHQDGLLGELLERQGFNGLPQLVADGDVARLQAAGDILVHRGIKPTGPDGDINLHVEAYKRGEHFTGQGIYGNGVYASDVRKTALSYAEGKDSGVIKMLIRADARVITRKELDSLDDALGAKLRADKAETMTLAFEVGAKEGPEAANAFVKRRNAELDEAFEAMAVIRKDPGRLAAYYGYDVIRVDTAGSESFFVVLNRTSVRLVDDATLPLAATSKADLGVGLPYALSKKQLDAIAARADADVLGPLAEQYGVSKVEIERRLLAEMRLHVEGQVPRVRAGGDAAELILGDGLFRTDFEMRVRDVEARRAAELAGLGAPLDLDPKLRPVYAYYDTERHGATAYGGVEFVMKPSVLPRTTVTLGDSLFPMQAGTMAGVPANDLSKHAFGNLYSANSLLRKDMGETYIEAQIHGGLKLADVDQIVLHRTLDNADELARVEKLYREAGIKVSYGTDDEAGLPPRVDTSTTVPLMDSAGSPRDGVEGLSAGGEEAAKAAAKLAAEEAAADDATKIATAGAEVARLEVDAKATAEATRIYLAEKASALDLVAAEAERIAAVEVKRTEAAAKEAERKRKGLEAAKVKRAGIKAEKIAAAEAAADLSATLKADKLAADKVIADALAEEAAEAAAWEAAREAERLSKLEAERAFREALDALRAKEALEAAAEAAAAAADAAAKATLEAARIEEKKRRALDAAKVKRAKIKAEKLAAATSTASTPTIVPGRSEADIRAEIVDLTSRRMTIMGVPSTTRTATETAFMRSSMSKLDALEDELIALKSAVAVPIPVLPIPGVTAPPAKVLRPTADIAAEIADIDAEVDRLRAKRLHGPDPLTPAEELFMKTRRKDKLDPLWAAHAKSVAEDDAIKAWTPPAAGRIAPGAKAYRAVLSLESEITSIETEVSRLGRKSRRGETLTVAESDFLGRKDALLPPLLDELDKSREEDKTRVAAPVPAARATSGKVNLQVRTTAKARATLQATTKDDLQRRGADPDKALAALKELVDNTPIMINSKSDIIGHFQRGEERFKSQFETGTSMGANDNVRRARAEHAGLGYSSDPDKDRSLRPIYGYVNVPGNAASSYGGRGGGLGWTLRDDVRERMTFTMGDSLGPMGSKSQFGTPMLDPDFEGIGSTYSQSSLVAYASSKRTKADKERFMSDIAYVEWQCQGQLLLSDVVSCNDPSNSLSASDIRWLADRGIPVTHNPTR